MSTQDDGTQNDRTDTTARAVTEERVAKPTDYHPITADNDGYRPDPHERMQRDSSSFFF